MAAPDRGEAVDERQHRIGIRCDIRHREIVAYERNREASERHRDESALGTCKRARASGPGGYPACRADKRQHAGHDREEQRHDQRKLTEFRDHRVTPAGASALSDTRMERARLMASAASGGMYFSSCLAST